MNASSEILVFSHTRVDLILNDLSHQYCGGTTFSSVIIKLGAKTGRLGISVPCSFETHLAFVVANSDVQGYTLLTYISWSGKRVSFQCVQNRYKTRKIRVIFWHFVSLLVTKPFAGG